MDYEPIFWDIETTGLNPMQQEWWSNAEQDAQVICVGIGMLTEWRDDPNQANKHIDIVAGNSEYNVIQRTKETLESVIRDVEGPDKLGEVSFSDDTEPFFVGWNSRQFDHPYYCARAGRLRLDPWPFGHDFRRLDMQRAVYNHTGRHWSQDDYADHLEVGREEDIEGSEVPQLFLNGRLDIIKRHCRLDVEDMMDIFLEEREVFMGEFDDHYSDVDPQTRFVEQI